MRTLLSLTLTGTLLAASVLTPAAPAQAQWRRDGYYHYHRHGIGPGAIVGGALLGLGVGALLAAPYYTPPPPAVYAPPPAYYPSPAYTYGYAPPPPVYYAPY